MGRRNYTLGVIVFLLGGTWSVEGQRQDKIVFESDHEGVTQIYSVNLDGTELTNLANTEIDVGQPACSPDGQRIALSFERNIYIIDTDGSNAVNITRDDDSNQLPSWSPDGTQIAFWKVPFDPETVEYVGDLYIVDVDGSNGRWLHNTWGGKRSSWSPRGDRIAYEGGLGQVDIHVIDIDGNNRVNLTNLPEGVLGNSAPTWSPNGDRIAYTGVRNRRTEIYLIDPDGAKLLNLTNTDMINEISPSWSPDGTKIAFVVWIEAGRQDLFLMSADGTNQAPLLEDFGQIDSPTWCSSEQVTLIENWSWGQIKARIEQVKP